MDWMCLSFKQQVLVHSLGSRRWIEAYLLKKGTRRVNETFCKLFGPVGSAAGLRRVETKEVIKSRDEGGGGRGEEEGEGDKIADCFNKL